MLFDAASQKLSYFKIPSHLVARTASLGNEFFAKCEMLSGKGKLRHELCLELLKGIDPPVQSININ
jgi:hypothetical protein